MKTEIIAISELRPNPVNPRSISEDKFRKLCQSLEDFPKMLELRPVIIDDDNIVLGGNMRLKAAEHIGLTHLPCVRAKDLSQKEKDEFIVKDNLGYGAWDWDTMGIQYELEQLEDWGLDVPNLEVGESEELEEEKETQQKICGNCGEPI